MWQALLPLKRLQHSPRALLLLSEETWNMAISSTPRWEINDNPGMALYIKWSCKAGAGMRSVVVPGWPLSAVALPPVTAADSWPWWEINADWWQPAHKSLPPSPPSSREKYYCVPITLASCSLTPKCFSAIFQKLISSKWGDIFICKLGPVKILVVQFQSRFFTHELNVPTPNQFCLRKIL